MTIEDAIRLFGSQSILCRALGIHKQSISQWRKQGYIPPYHQLKIEQLTQGKLKAGLEDIDK